MNVATGFDHRAYSLREFVEKIRIVDRVHRVEAQAVEAIFVQPVQCVVNEELAYRPAPEVDRRAPRCMAIFGEEIRCVGMEVIAVDRKSTRLTPVTNAHLVCRLLLEKKKNIKNKHTEITTERPH